MNGIKLLSLAFALVATPLSLVAASISPGDLIISEVMANPSSVSDTNGEWFEVYNLTGNALDLSGLTLSDDTSDIHTIDGSTPLIIDPYAYLVFGRNGATASNGGYTADYVYSGFNLKNDSDQIVISNGSTEIVRLEYTDGFAIAGKSQELSGNVSLPLSNTDFVTSVSSYGLGDLGTPGLPGGSTWSVQAMPLPGAIWLLGSACLGLLGVVRRNRQPI